MWNFDYAALGKKIKEERISRGWTQAEFSAQAGISTSHISAIERGCGDFSVKYLVKVVNSLNVSIDKILYDELYSPEICLKAIDEAIKDCTPWEVKVLTDCLLSVKASLRKSNLTSLADVEG